MIMMSRKYLIILGFSVLYCLSLGAAYAGSCVFPSPNSLDCTMTNGARWEFNWTNDAKKGIVLNQITLTAKPSAPRTLILNQASLAQVLVSYDNTVNNSANLHYLSNGLPLMQLNDDNDCPSNPGANRLKDNGVGPTLLCQVFMPRGYAWRGTGQIQGEQLVIFGVSAVAGDTYIQQWIFSDDGAILPMLGVSGQIDPAHDSTAGYGWPIGVSGSTRYATNRFHTSYWRLDFALGGQADDMFQQLDYSTDVDGYKRNQSITDITTEGQFNISPEGQRFWIVKDKIISNATNGQKIAFEIVPANTSVHRGTDALTGNDVYITQGGSEKNCEQFASHNPSSPGYPSNTECAEGLPQFLNGESLTDPVAWVGTTWHQVPRAEDEADIQMHWQGVILAPRDLTEVSPFN